MKNEKASNYILDLYNMYYVKINSFLKTLYMKIVV